MRSFKNLKHLIFLSSTFFVLTLISCSKEEEPVNTPICIKDKVSTEIIQIDTADAYKYKLTELLVTTQLTNNADFEYNLQSAKNKPLYSRVVINTVENTYTTENPLGVLLIEKDGMAQTDIVAIFNPEEEFKSISVELYCK